MEDDVISYDVNRRSMAMFTTSIFIVLNLIFVIILKQMNIIQLNFACI